MMLSARLWAACLVLGLGLGVGGSASAMNLQPGMLTMMQQGGTEHGVQSGCVLPGYDPRDTCAYDRHGRYRGAYPHRHGAAPFRRLSY